VIFVTLGMRYEAKMMKKQHPNVRVVVATGLLPDDEVIIMHRNWLTPQEFHILSSS
jgi:hypothetical protein